MLQHWEQCVSMFLKQTFLLIAALAVGNGCDSPSTDPVGTTGTTVAASPAATLEPDASTIVDSGPDGGMAVEPDPATLPPTPGAPQTEAVEHLNRASEDARVVLYDSVDVAMEVRDGLAISPDDAREIWRFSVPRDVVQAALEIAQPARMQLPPGTTLTLHRIDPSCYTRRPCTMTTLLLAEGSGLTGEGVFRTREDGRLSVAFDVRADIPVGMETATIYYTGGAFEP